MGLTEQPPPFRDRPLRRCALRDSSTVWVGPLLAQDRQPLAAWYDTLSPSTKRHRFLADEEHLTPAMLDHLVDRVDGTDHVAMVAFAPARDADPDSPDVALVGVARLVRLPDQPSAADVAVTIDDAWHGRGLATALLPVLLAHRPKGVTHLRTSVARDNPASVAMLSRVGTLRRVGAERGVVDVEVALANP